MLSVGVLSVECPLLRHLQSQQSPGILCPIPYLGIYAYSNTQAFVPLQTSLLRHLCLTNSRHLRAAKGLSIHFPHNPIQQSTVKPTNLSAPGRIWSIAPPTNLNLYSFVHDRGILGSLSRHSPSKGRERGGFQIFFLTVSIRHLNGPCRVPINA